MCSQLLWVSAMSFNRRPSIGMLLRPKVYFLSSVSTLVQTLVEGNSDRRTRASKNCSMKDLIIKESIIIVCFSLILFSFILVFFALRGWSLAVLISSRCYTLHCHELLW